MHLGYANGLERVAMQMTWEIWAIEIKLQIQILPLE